MAGQEGPLGTKGACEPFEWRWGGCWTLTGSVWKCVAQVSQELRHPSWVSLGLRVTEPCKPEKHHFDSIGIPSKQLWAKLVSRNRRRPLG